MSIEGGCERGDTRRGGRKGSAGAIREGKGIRFTARSPGSQPATVALGFPLRHYPLLSLPSPRVLSAPLISPPSLALPAFTHTSRRRKGRSSCVKLVAKRADERACMRISLFFFLLLEETWGLACRGEEEKKGREGEEARMRKEREASNGSREREERQNAVVVPVRC